MRRYWWGVAGVAGSVLVGVAYQYWPEWVGPYAEQLRQLKYADIDADVEAAVARGDHRYVGYYAEGLIVPDVPAREASLGPKDVRVIPNTSDSFSTRQEGLLLDAAEDYAGAYNRSLRRRLGE